MSLAGGFGGGEALGDGGVDEPFGVEPLEVVLDRPGRLGTGPTRPIDHDAELREFVAALFHD